MEEAHGFVGNRMAVGERERLRKSFEKDYPGTVLCGATLAVGKAGEWLLWEESLCEDDVMAVKWRKHSSAGRAKTFYVV